MPNNKNGKNYKVGWKKPPIHTQFKKGKSGNPAGRPKLPSDIESLVKRSYMKKATVIDQGRRRRRTKLEISFDQLANRSAAGNPRSLELGARLMGYPKKRKEEEPGIDELVRKFNEKVVELPLDELKQLHGLLAKMGLTEDEID